MSQKAKLLTHFRKFHTLTALEAMGLYGCFRLAARVHELKQKGHKIITVLKRDPNGKQYAQYRYVGS